MILAYAAAAVFTVAPSGSDANPGAAEQPWRTISHAARTVGPGDVVDVRAGTYRERVVMRADGATFRAHPGESVVITRRRGPEIVNIRGRRDITFEGFELRGLRGDGAGVRVSGRSSGIVLRGLEIHDIRTDGDAHGILVYGATSRSPT